MRTVFALGLALMLSALPTVFSVLVADRRQASGTTIKPTVTTPPTYCNCIIVGGVGAHLWYSSIVTTYVATLVYSVDRNSGSTLGSSLIYNTITTNVGTQPNYTALAGTGGGVEYTTVNNISSVAVTTLLQSNEIVSLTYYLNTTSINASLTGTAMTQCVASAPYTPTAVNTSGILPTSTFYTFTAVIPYNGTTIAVESAKGAGTDVFAAMVASILHISNCTFYGGGIATVKVPVSVLTSVSTTFVAQLVTTAPLSTSTAAATTAAAPSPTVSALPASTSTTARTSTVASSAAAASSGGASSSGAASSSAVSSQRTSTTAATTTSIRNVTFTAEGFRFESETSMGMWFATVMILACIMLF